MKLHFRILTLFLLVCGCASTQEPDFAPKQPHIKILTYNVNWGFVNPDKVVRYLATEDADIICLQETNVHWKRYLGERLRQQYTTGRFRDWSNAGGTAIISKYKIYDLNLLEPRSTWFPAFYALADTPIGTIQLLNVHLKPPMSEEGKLSATAYPKTGDEHIAEMEWFLRRTDPNQPMIILGDFNENEKGKAIRRLIEAGWTNALSRYDKKSITWQLTTPEGLEFKERFDHILYNQFLDCTGAKVVDTEGSDHFPVVAIIVQKAENK